ncbi:MAG: CtsR family transcriptional regulator [Oscillospiraceae bacterium]|nr:CtsR family transcriptional regulator [Oscillospiraceae bacterium]MBQ2178626.1 CtsR family transcriptional regulator [Oscillospiraceae bacterium]MBQ5535333.1 CtsR family transcriptional regulator [Oscillospiraceae bacterium]
MGISDLIAAFIRDSLDDADGVLELQRSDLAERFHCVPSQINYVMATRFAPENGYIVESRRGGGGYIRIMRVHVGRSTLLMSVINSLGESIDRASAMAIVQNLSDAGAIGAETAQLLQCALSDAALRSLNPAQRGSVRADLMRQVLIHAAHDAQD